MVNPVLDDKDRCLGKLRKVKSSLEESKTEFLLEVRKLERRRLSVKELLAIGDLSLEKISRISGFSTEELHRIQALSKPR